MSIAIEETKEILESVAARPLAFIGDDGKEYVSHDVVQAAILQAVDALDLLDEALAEATSLSDEVAEALDVMKTLGLEGVPSLGEKVVESWRPGLILP